MPNPKRSDTPHLLFVNPWIHDFAAYDFWSKPLGLLYLAAWCRQHGFRISYVDCLDRFHPNAPPSDPNARCGRGPYRKTRIPKPAGLADVPRQYSRYGIPPDGFDADLQRLDPPDVICLGSLMTYWYPGVVETAERLKQVFPDTPILLGGIYATLCPEHARSITAVDRVITGPGVPQLAEVLEEITGTGFSDGIEENDPDRLPVPAFDLQRMVAYAPLLTSVGCPYSCAYCASHLLNPDRFRRSPDAVVDEIRHWHTDHGVRDFVLYDDAFLVDADRHAVPMLEAIVGSGMPLRFHTPNALHVREIDSETAALLYRANFHTLRLGLETTVEAGRAQLDRKVTLDEFRRAADRLASAGFGPDRAGAYLLVGLPGQSMTEVAESIAVVKESGLTPIPAYYSPIPGTALWEAAKRGSRYDLESDPIFTNNAILPCRQEPFSWDIIARLKALIQ